MLEAMLTRFRELQKTAYATPRYAVWPDEAAMARHIAVVERDYAGFWGPYTSLSAVERAGFVDGNFQPWDKHHRPDLVEAQKKQLLSK